MKQSTATTSGASLETLLDPLSLHQYGMFTRFVARIPPKTPDRFEVIRGLMLSNHDVDFSAARFQNLHNKMRLEMGAEVVDRQERLVSDPNDYGEYVVIAIPAINTCVHCKGQLVVNKSPSLKPYFYRLSGEAVQGRSFTKGCRNLGCLDAGASSYGYSYWTDKDGRRRMYSPTDVNFNVYEQEWHQSTNETYHENILLRHTEMALFYGHDGSLTSSNIFNTTHGLTRFTVAPPRASDGHAPPPPPPHEGPTQAKQTRSMRHQVERRSLQKAMHGRRVFKFVFEHAPHLCPKITPDIGDNLKLAMIMVN
jgi:hypothetical protein